MASVGEAPIRITCCLPCQKNKMGHPLFVKMKIIHDLSKETVQNFVKTNIEKKSTLFGGGHASLLTLKEDYTIQSKKFNAKEVPEHLKWLHTTVSNLKSFVQGTFYGLDSRHLQRYLDEFCYRFNRRKFAQEGFNRLLHSCLVTTTITYAELT